MAWLVWHDVAHLEPRDVHGVYMGGLLASLKSTKPWVMKCLHRMGNMGWIRYRVLEMELILEANSCLASD